MKQARYKEPLPLAVIEAARAGDAGAVEQVLQYYNGYMNKLCTLAFGHIDTNSVHLKYLLIDKIHGDRFYSLPVQSPGRLHERTERRWDNLLKSNAANERGG